VLAAVCDSLRLGLPDLLAEVRHELTFAYAPVIRLDAARLELARRETRRQAHRPGDALLLAA
jgi:hypothetical protein